jgi:hypothetical protein
MKKRIILAIALVLIASATGVETVYRLQQVPSFLTVYVTFYSLSRNRDQSYSGYTVVSMEMTATNKTADNVTLVSPPFPNQPTHAYWMLQIVLNESMMKVVPWEHNIEQYNDTAGEFAGTVSSSFAGLNGNFTVWIVLRSMYGSQPTGTVIWSKWEVIQIY